MSIPDPIDKALFDKAPYLSLAAQKDFQFCIRDVIERSGATEDKISEMLGSIREPNMSVYHEFAKCFVPLAIDRANNYELYELIGDLALNKATIGYLFRILFKPLSERASEKAIGYMDGIKATYVSKKFYATLTKQLGFDEFVHRVCFSNKRAIDTFLASTKKNAQDLYEDVIEAFIGCLEIQFDRYIGMHQGYAFIANFVYDLLSTVEIDFNPSTYWEAARLLKETNDKISAYNQANPQQPLQYYRFIKTGFRTYIAGLSKNRYTDTNFIQRDQQDFQAITSTIEADTQKIAENELGRQVIEHLSRDLRYNTVLQKPPTPEELGIQHLLR